LIISSYQHGRDIWREAGRDLILVLLTIEIHHSPDPKLTTLRLNGSRAQRIVWLLEECKDIDYKIEVFKRGEDKFAPKELKEVHPLGKSPLIKVQASGMKPLIIAETGAIIEYLTEHFATHLIPKRYQDGMEGKVGGETEQWLRYRFYSHYVEGSLMTPLILSMFMVSPVVRNVLECDENLGHH